MNGFIRHYATPLTTGLFVVSGVSGIALFFRWQTGLFHQMHEWLSMLLLLPFALHVWKNWTFLVAYFRRGTLTLPVAATILIALPFAWPALTGKSGRGGGPPGARAVAMLTQAPIAVLAPVLKTNVADLTTKLVGRGYIVPTAEDTLETIAATAGVSVNEVLAAAFPTRQQ